ncbi:MAG: D-alanine--D-alanine ligase family protein [Bacillota bacterium]
MEKINVALLFGGRSGEHEVSLNSAFSIANGFNNDNYNVIPVGIAKNGIWYGPVDIKDIKEFKPDMYKGAEVTILPQQNSKLYSLSQNQEILTLDVIFPIIHGTFGEDGTLQGLLEMSGIPYVGSGVLGSAVGMDKVVMKQIFAYHNLPQVNFTYIYRHEYEKDPQAVKRKIISKLKFPMFIKPANLGSSVGISKVKSENQLFDALSAASKYDSKIIIEEGMDVREIEVSVLGNENPQASIPGEIIPSNEFYDYKAKYIDNQSTLEIPANLDMDTTNLIRKIAIDAYLAAECSGLARVDFFLCKNTGEILINEINTLPGFTTISMYPKLWEYSGLEMQQLLDKLIQLAFEKHKEKNKNLTTFSVETA